MEIIKASERQIDGIMNLCKKCSVNMIDKGIDQWDEVYPNKEVFLNDIRNDSLFIVRSNNLQEIIGCIVLNEYQDREYQDVNWKYDGGKVAVIHRLMVHPQYEGRGIAQHLVRYVEELVKKSQYDAIRLDVFCKNPRAINFYNKLGYEVAGKVTFRKGFFWCCEKSLN